MTDGNESVWRLEQGEVRKPGIAHVVALALFTGIGIVVGTFGSLAVPIGFVSAFWPGQAIQAVGSIWYGGWGGIAAFVFPLISNAMSGSAPLPVSLAYIPGNLVQGIAAGWIFRQLNLNPPSRRAGLALVSPWSASSPRMRSARCGARWSSAGSASSPPTLTWLPGPAGSSGNTVASWVLGVLMLKFISPLVVKTKAFCKGYWA